MKGWKIVNANKVIESDVSNKISSNNVSKVKIAKSLITLADVLRFNGESPTENVVLGSSGIGVVTETDTNLFGLEKGNHVYIEPYRTCNECYNCKMGDVDNCSDIKIAGEDFDGFLSDFACADSGYLHILPDSVSDFQALFIDHISTAITIVDKLNINKGDYVAIIGSDNFSIILAQLLIYYQAVPILMTDQDEDVKIAKDSKHYWWQNG